MFGDMSSSSVLPECSSSDRADSVRKSGKAYSTVFSSWKLSALRKPRRMATRYHILDSMDEWLAIQCSSVETVVLHEAKVPRFEFNVKIATSLKYRDFYLSKSTIVALREIEAHIKVKNLKFKPNHHIIKFAFEHIEATNKLPRAPVSRRHQYPQPADQHVALAVVKQLFDTKDVLGTGNDDLIVYYYLCVLRAVNHPIINHARFVVNDCAMDNHGVFNSAFVPKCEKPNFQINFYSLYADLVYFLSLLAPPINAGDNVHTISTKIRTRHLEQLRILCNSVGITKYQPIHRGEGWQKVIKFYELNPLVCRVLSTTLLKPPEIHNPLTVIENQVVDQVKQLWRWTGLHNFRDCYEFATSVNRTEAHHIPVIAEQCELVSLLYQKLEEAVVEERLIPYAKLLVDDVNGFFDQYDTRNYPDLFYACKSMKTYNKRGNVLWEEFVATRPVTIPRKEIDEKLLIKLSSTIETAPLDHHGACQDLGQPDGPSHLEELLPLSDGSDEEDNTSFKSDYFVDDTEDSHNNGKSDHDSSEFVVCEYPSRK